MIRTLYRTRSGTGLAIVDTMQHTAELLERIEKFRALGMTDAVILGRLQIEGYSQEIVADLLGGDAKPGTRKRQGRNMRKLQTPLLVLSVALLAIGVGISLRALTKPAVVYSISLMNETASTSAPLLLTYGALPQLSNPDYYAQMKQKLIDAKASFINADLSAMQLSVYKNGEVALQVAIAAKGRPGSWWETPAGIYKIESKEPNHLSSIGDVYMPYSMDFQGNFFIHGWPVYKNGTPVATSYSGGCIRLSTEDAKRVYDMVDMGMPVVVYAQITPGDSFNYELKAPQVSAQEYLVADLSNGTVLTSKNASTSAPIASITKLVTALVATEYINLDRKITVPSEALVYTTVPRLRTGESVRAYDLLALLLMESSNEAAETLAAAHGRAQFVEYMNDKAQAIGLAHTTFSDPSGAQGDFSTPEDLFTLLRYIYDNRQFVFSLTTGTLKDSAYGRPSYSGIANFNIVPNLRSSLLGGKVGETNEAKETYAGIFVVNVGGEPRKIAVIILGSDDEYADVRALVSFVERAYAPGEQ
jgi:hypothetical protein